MSNHEQARYIRPRDKKKGVKPRPPIEVDDGIERRVLTGNDGRTVVLRMTQDGFRREVGGVLEDEGTYEKRARGGNSKNLRTGERGEKARGTESWLHRGDDDLGL